MKTRFLILFLLFAFLLTGCSSLQRFIFSEIVDSKLPPEYGAATWTSNNPEMTFVITDSESSIADAKICKYYGEITINGEHKNAEFHIDLFDKTFEIYETRDGEYQKLLHAYFISSDAEKFEVSVEEDNIYDNAYKEIVFQKNT